ncbi:hypothetical protein A0H81_05152 [Grifola frondosa]|uniref:Uncharacterized protein n=1 Tax=Grifola frondosa TaxID=5627 RepID=A0A1C7MCD0_GRIFR|nr:hypothetical protein A0H81_05152 [Grifola frondosa]
MPVSNIAELCNFRQLRTYGAPAEQRLKITTWSTVHRAGEIMGHIRFPLRNEMTRTRNFGSAYMWNAAQRGRLDHHMCPAKIICAIFSPLPSSVANDLSITIKRNQIMAAITNRLKAALRSRILNPRQCGPTEPHNKQRSVCINGLVLATEPPFPLSPFLPPYQWASSSAVMFLSLLPTSLSLSASSLVLRRLGHAYVQGIDDVGGSFDR